MFLGYNHMTDEWVRNEDEFDNAFYRDLINLRSNWQQQRVQSGRDLFEWRNSPQNNRVFINSDISLWKDIDDRIINADNGRVSCSFNQCPLNVNNGNPSGFVQLYAENNQIWLNDFAASFQQMIQMGYDNLEILTGDDGGSDDAESTSINSRRRRRRNSDSSGRNRRRP